MQSTSEVDLATDSGRAFLQERLALLGRVLTSFAALDTIRGAGGLAPFSLVAVLWRLRAVAMATVTVTSQVIYGLRQQVREATQLGKYPLDAGGWSERRAREWWESRGPAIRDARHLLHRAPHPPR